MIRINIIVRLASLKINVSQVIRINIIVRLASLKINVSQVIRINYYREIDII